MNKWKIENYRICITKHAALRCKQRKIKTENIINSLHVFGIDNINQYKNNNNDIMLQDKEHNYTLIFSINGNKIIVITVIDKNDVYVKRDSNTIIKNL